MASDKRGKNTVFQPLALAYVGFSGLVFFALGGWALLLPGHLFPLLSLAEVSGDGLVELVAMYGGVELAIGTFGLLALFFRQWLPVAIAGYVVVYAGFALGRFAGLLHVGDMSASLWGYWLAEVVLAVAGLLWLIRHYRAHD